MCNFVIHPKNLCALNFVYTFAYCTEEKAKAKENSYIVLLKDLNILQSISPCRPHFNNLLNNTM